MAGEAAVGGILSRAVMLEGAATSEHVAVNMPAEPQQWRTGVYKLIGDRCFCAACEM